MKSASWSRFSLLILAIASLPVLGVETWEIDSAHSTAHFRVKHMMINNVNGDLGGFKGTVVTDGEDLTKLKVDVTLDTKTLTTSNAKRDDHLKGPDFFDVKKYPSIAFKSSKAEKSGDTAKLSGDLTMHGVTKPVTFDVESFTAPVTDPWGQKRRGLSATTKINRKDFDIKWNKNLDGGGLLVGEEVSVTVDAELMVAGQPPTKPVDKKADAKAKAKSS